MLFWYVFFFQRFWSIGKIRKQWHCQPSTHSFFHMNSWTWTCYFSEPSPTAPTLPLTPSTFQECCPTVSSWGPLRGVVRAKWNSPETARQSAGSCEERHQKDSFGQMTFQIRPNGLRLLHLPVCFRPVQMVQEQVYVMLRFRKFSTHFVICAYQDQQCDSGLSWGRGWSCVDFRRLERFSSLRKSTRLHPLPICNVASRTEFTVETSEAEGRNVLNPLGIARPVKKTRFFLRGKVLGCVRFVVDACKHVTLGISTINTGCCIFQTWMRVFVILRGHEV